MPIIDNNFVIFVKSHVTWRSFCTFIYLIYQYIFMDSFSASVLLLNILIAKYC